jgi:hypothetical protein
MNNTSVFIGGASLTEAEVKMVGELLVASYNSHKCEQMMKKISTDSPLGKHSAYLKKAEALRYEAEQHRLLSCLYESTADRAEVIEFLNNVFDLLK